MSADIKVIGIFGASLEDTLKHAGVAVGIFDESDEAYVFGSVPLVVAQCGVFLKEKGKFIPASCQEGSYANWIQPLMSKRYSP